MKKLLLLLLCGILVFCFAACRQEKPDTTQSTPIDTTSGVEETTEAVVQSFVEDYPVEGRQLSETEMEFFRSLLEFPGKDPIWYNIATTHLFDSPENINLDYLLYAMPRLQRGLTGEEKAFLETTSLRTCLPSYIKENYRSGYMEFGIFEASEIDGVLQKYFGITLEVYEKPELGAVYWDDTDCYYNARNDTLRGSPLIKAIYQREGGYYDIYYKTADYDPPFVEISDSAEDPVKERKDMMFCLTLKGTGDGYQIVSNTRLYHEE